jgi:hypothetical protein
MIVLVLGVHRSGTSLLTAGLKAIGCQTGDFEEHADEHNPKGYFEHPHLRMLNEDLLRSLGVSWDNWAFHAPSQQAVDHPSIDDWYRRASAFVRGLSKSGSTIALKDPRTSALLPFWNRVMERAELECRRILIIRDPAEVADSQYRRAQKAPHQHKIIADRESMAALWAVTMHSILQSLPQADTLMVNHGNLCNNPKVALLACARFLGLDPEQSALEGFSHDFFDPALRRSSPSAACTGPWSAMAESLYVALATAGNNARLNESLGRQLASAQTKLTEQIQLLPAARASISHLLTASVIETASLRERVEKLTRAIWALNDLAMPREDIKSRPAMAVLEELAVTLETDPPVGVVAARMAIHGGYYESAKRILDLLLMRLPDHPVTSRMLLALLEATEQHDQADRVRTKLGSPVSAGATMESE